MHAICELTPDLLLSCDLPGYERGRKAGVVAELIRDLAIAEGVPEQAVLLFDSPIEGVKHALAGARAGDCMVLLALTQRDEVLELIRAFVAGD